MKRLNTKGFSVAEAFLILLVIGIISAVAFFVDSPQKKTTTKVSSVAKSQNESQKTTTYTFKELGISMDILEGWEVKANPTQEEGSSFYKWKVQKPGADGEIALSSTGFRGGFEDCGVSRANVEDVVPTGNPKLMFMSWSYNYENKTQVRTSIVRADEANFSMTANDKDLISPIKNMGVTPGSYYFCIGRPVPGFSLGLNSEPATGFSRIDEIRALPSQVSNNEYVELSPTAKSYVDIKTMLTSIK